MLQQVVSQASVLHTLSHSSLPGNHAVSSPGRQVKPIANNHVSDMGSRAADPAEPQVMAVLADTNAASGETESEPHS